jgi:hypothetical protein
MDDEADRSESSVPPQLTPNSISPVRGFVVRIPEGLFAFSMFGTAHDGAHEKAHERTLQ